MLINEKSTDSMISFLLKYVAHVYIYVYMYTYVCIQIQMGKVQKNYTLIY